MSLDVVCFLSAEIVLVVAALAIYLGGAFSASQKVWAPMALGAIVLAAVSLWSCGGNERYIEHRAAAIFNMPTRNDYLIRGCSANLGQHYPVTPTRYPPSAAGCPGIGAVMVLMAWRPLAMGGTPEYLGSLLLIIAGLMLVASAANLVLLFVGLELISIPTYILLSLGRRDPAGQEAAAKYFYLSVLSSAILLYGLSFLYGTTGTMQLAGCLRQRGRVHGLRTSEQSGHGPGRCRSLLPRYGRAVPLLRPGRLPGHDPGQRRPAFRAAQGGRTSGLGAADRAGHAAEMGPFAWKIFLVLSILTMTLGNVLALWQENVRRLFAYSSIANAGYMLIGLAVGWRRAPISGLWDGIGAMFFYLCVYVAATLGTFAVLAYLGRQRQQIETVEELAGLGRTQPVMAAALAVCMFSLAGLPPAAGLWGKLMLFGSALNVQEASGVLRPWFIALAIIGVLNAAVAAYYYLRIVSLMYFREPLATPRAEGGPGPYVAALLCSLAVLVLGFYPGPLLKGCSEAGGGSEERGVDEAPAQRVAERGVGGGMDEAGRLHIPIEPGAGRSHKM